MEQLYTKWGREFDRKRVLPEYPRPQMKRDSYVNLNGEWEYSFTPDGVKNPSKVEFIGTITVPYSPESCLSGVKRCLKPGELLWYRRKVSLPGDYDGDKRLLLHFGAVDQMCRIYVNRIEAGRHIGGYLPFTLDITDYVNDRARAAEIKGSRKAAEDGKDLLQDCFELIVCVKDGTETNYHSRGKQLLKRGGMFYTAQSGIWQTVWMECVPKLYIRGYRMTPDIISGKVGCEIELNREPGRIPKTELEVRKPFIDPAAERDAEELKGNSGEYSENFRDTDFYSLKEVFRENNSVEDISVKERENGLFLEFSIPDRRLWSPDRPYLYYFRLRVGEDEVTGYFAFRKFSVEKNDLMSHPRICLNLSPFFQNGVLDQGYYPEGLYTAPSDAAYIYDILKMKNLGYNMLRKHLKIEPDRYYYHCDRLGMSVWQDMVNGGSPYRFWFVTYVATAFNVFRYRIFDNCYRLLSREDKAGRREFEREMVRTARLLYNHPCISAWVIFNEGWGQFDAVRMTKRLKLIDPGRLIDSASGWFDQGCGDLRSQHYYFMKLRIQWCFKRATVISEYGGFPCRIEGHSASERIYGYHNCRNLKELHCKYERLMKDIIDPEVAKGLSAVVYTQLSDVEDEVNGILTYDREICKFDSIERQKG
ncbi:MAG: glycoside hydrolase family 2 [Lachnospiraceae bacterium]|nr:glycoside hydrolase family 2 [Lachnospiraceae bacterium]